MHKLINHLLNLHPFCPHLFNLRRNVYRRFIRPFQQFNQHLTAGQRDRMALQIIVLQLQNDFALLCYLLFSSVGTVPISDISDKNSVTSPPINPNPTLLQMHSCFPAVLNLLFVVLPRRALWDHPERKQTTLQTPTFSLHPTHGKLLELWRSTSHQNFSNLKGYSETK